MDWKNLVLQLAVIGLGSNPKTAKLVPHVITGIQEAEAMIGASKAEKLAHAVALTKAGLAGANAVRPGSVDETVADEVISSAISATVNATNAFTKAPHIVVGK